MAKVKLSGFGDEIARELEKQLSFMEMLGIHAIETRGIDGVNVSSLTDWQARKARATLDAHGFEVSALGSPIGKTDIADDFGKALDSFKRTLDIAAILRAPAIRLFSFYVPTETADDMAEESISRLARMKEAAHGSGVVLLHENESGIYGETPAHGLKLAEALCDDEFGLIFDPSNYVQRGWNVLDAWKMLKPYVRYMHIKDSVKLSDGTDMHTNNPHRVSGDGEAHIRELLTSLRETDYQGYLSIEPHLGGSKHVAGTPAGKWAAAALALQGLLDETEINWQED